MLGKETKRLSANQRTGLMTPTKSEKIVSTIPDAEIYKNVGRYIANVQNRFIIPITKNSDFLTCTFFKL